MHSAREYDGVATGDGLVGGVEVRHNEHVHAKSKKVKAYLLPAVVLARVTLRTMLRLAGIASLERYLTRSE